MVLYGITLVSLVVDLRCVDPTLLSPFYYYDVAFDGLVRRSATQLCLFMDRGPEQGYFYELSKPLFIAENPKEKEVMRQEFEQAGLNLTYVDDSKYLGAYLGTMEEIEAWVRPKVEAWAHRVHKLAKIAKCYLQLAYASLDMSLQLDCQYLQSSIPGVGTIMGSIEDALRKAFFPELVVGEEVSIDLRKILGHSMKHSVLDISDPWMLAERAYNTSKAASEVLIGSLLGGTDLNYVAHKA